MSTLYSWMTVARKESLKSNYKHQLGAVIVKGGSIISKGFNQIRHCAEVDEFIKHNGSIHAERDAIRKASKDKLKGSTIYVYREYKNGQPALAMPCISCFNLIKAMGIKKIIFSQSEFPFYGEIKL